MQRLFVPDVTAASVTLPRSGCYKDLVHVREGQGGDELFAELVTELQQHSTKARRVR